MGRFGRSVVDATRAITELVARRILLRAWGEGIDTATPTGRAVVAAIMATLTELQPGLGRKRCAASRQSRRTRQLPATKPTKLTFDRQEQFVELPRPAYRSENLLLRSGFGAQRRIAILLSGNKFRQRGSYVRVGVGARGGRFARHVEVDRPDASRPKWNNSCLYLVEYVLCREAGT